MQHRQVARQVAQLLGTKVCPVRRDAKGPNRSLTKSGASTLFAPGNDWAGGVNARLLVIVPMISLRIVFSNAFEVGLRRSCAGLRCSDLATMTSRKAALVGPSAHTIAHDARGRSRSQG